MTLSPELAAHAAVALTGYRRALNAARQLEPPGLAELAAELGRVATKGQHARVHVGDGHGGVMTYLSVAEAAGLLSISTRSVHRHVASGVIRSTRLGRRRLIPADAICTVEAS